MKKSYLSVLPMSVTLSSILFGFLALIWAPEHTYWSCVAIVLSCLCDTVDGRIARITKTESELGAQLDSLADIVSFGLAPAYTFYHWAFAKYFTDMAVNPWVFLAFTYVAAGAIRLARFNVKHEEGAEVAWTFQGTPIPAAALTIICLMMASIELNMDELRNPYGVSALVLFVSWLMVSRVHFPSYKRFRNRWVQLGFYGFIVGGLGTLCFGGPGGAIVFCLMIAYILYGLVNAWVFARNERAQMA